MRVQMMGISGSRVREVLGSGQLPGTKRGGAWFIRRRDVEAFAGLPEGRARPGRGPCVNAGGRPGPQAPAISAEKVR
jgi:hypothetical protein